jgi:hypothetical protein
MRSDSFSRWQSISIQQLGLSINLILVLGTSSLGFALSLARDSDFQTYCVSKALFTGSLFLLIGSVGLGIWCTLNRSFDFRVTIQIAHDREEWEGEGQQKEEIDKKLLARRGESMELGNRTWHLFYGQIVTFGLGILSLIIAFGIVYRTRLF